MAYTGKRFAFEFYTYRFHDVCQVVLYDMADVVHRIDVDGYEIGLDIIEQLAETGVLDVKEVTNAELV